MRFIVLGFIFVFAAVAAKAAVIDDACARQGFNLSSWPDIPTSVTDRITRTVIKYEKYLTQQSPRPEDLVFTTARSEITKRTIILVEVARPNFFEPYYFNMHGSERPIPSTRFRTDSRFVSPRWLFLGIKENLRMQDGRRIIIRPDFTTTWHILRADGGWAYPHEFSLPALNADEVDAWGLPI